MTTEIVVAVIGLAGSAIGSFVGIVVNSKLTNHRIQQLERRVEEHNSYGMRIPVLEEKLKALNYRVIDLEKERQ